MDQNVCRNLNRWRGLRDGCVDAINFAMKYGRDAFKDGKNKTLASLEAGSYCQNNGVKNEVAW